MSLTRHTKAALHTDQLLELLDQPIDPSFAACAVEEPELDVAHPAIRIEGLQVEYQTEDGSRRHAVSDVSLSVRHGETLGVAGRSGGGKTSLLRVLLRLTHPVGGRTWLGGVPLERVSRAAIGRLVGYVGQSPFVFAGTLADNIAYGAGPTSAEAIERAARLACLHEEIMAMPLGYQSRSPSAGKTSRAARSSVSLWHGCF